MALNKTVTIINLTNNVGQGKILSLDGKFSNLRIPPVSAVTEDYYNLQLDENVADLLSSWISSGLVQVQVDGVVQSSSQVAAWKYSFDFAALTSFDDSTFFIYDNTTPSKKLAFQCSGISAGTTRTVTIPDASGTLALTSNITLQGSYLGGQSISTTAAGPLAFNTIVTPITFTIGGPPVTFVSSSGVGSGFQLVYNGPAERVSVVGDCRQWSYAATLAQTTSTGGAAILLNASSGGIQFIGNNAALDAIDIDSIGGMSVDVAAISLDSTDTSNFTLTANNAADKTLTIAASNSGAGNGLITISADSVIIKDVNLIAGIPISQALTTGLSGFTAISIVGALNELKLWSWASVINLDIDTGTENVDAFDPGADGGATWHVFVTKADGSTMTEYTVNACWDYSAGTVSFRSEKSVDIGAGTGDLTLAVTMSGAGGNVQLAATAASDNWSVKGIRFFTAI